MFLHLAFHEPFLTPRYIESRWSIGPNLDQVMQYQRGATFRQLDQFSILSPQIIFLNVIVSWDGAATRGGVRKPIMSIWTRFAHYLMDSDPPHFGPSSYWSPCLINHSRLVQINGRMLCNGSRGSYPGRGVARLMFPYGIRAALTLFAFWTRVSAACSSFLPSIMAAQWKFGKERCRNIGGLIVKIS